MRKLLRLPSVLLILGWIGTAVYRAADDGFAPRAFLFGPPSTLDYLGFALVLLGCVGLGLTRTGGTKRSVLAVGLLGLLLAAGGYLGGMSAAIERQEKFAPLSFHPQMKPNLDQTVLGYHMNVPTRGGPVAFANGSVRHVTSDQFVQAPKAAPPDQEGAWTSPVKPATPDPPADPQAADAVRDAERIVREAAERTRLSNDLKQLAIAYHQASGRLQRAPLNPDELLAGATVDPDLREALTDGTYVMYFGWNRGPADEARMQRTMRRLDQLSWLGLHTCFLGTALLAYTLVALVRQRRTTAPALPAPPAPPV